MIMLFKRYIHSITVLLLTVLLLGCRKDETPTVSVGEKVRLEAVIAKNHTSNDNTKATPSTDVAGGVFEAGDEFGFFLKAQSGYHAGNSNVKYTTSLDAQSKLIYTAQAPLLYYDYDLHALHGYYPYVSAVTGANVEFEIKTDQRGSATVAPILSNYTLSDLMWSTESSVRPQTKFDEAIKLTFDHKLSNIIVTLINRINAPFAGEIPRIWLRGVVNKVSLDVETGVVTPTVASVSDIEMEPYKYIPVGGYVENTTTELHYRAIAVPQNFTAGTAVLKINSNNVTYQVITTAALNFEEGKQYQIDVTNSGVDFRLSGCSVKEWGAKVVVDGGAIGGDGVLPCTMLFNVSGVESANVAKAVLNIDGEDYVSTAVNLAASTLKVTYDQGAHWGSKLARVTFYNSSNVELPTDKTGLTLDWNITGDPTNISYSTIIGNVNFN